MSSPDGSGRHLRPDPIGIAVLERFLGKRLLRQSGYVGWIGMTIEWIDEKVLDS